MSARILVVDDQEPNRRLLADLLGHQGYAVAQANGGQTALEALEAAVFDLVLLDVMMPDIDGFEVLRWVRASPRHQHLPVVLCTALDPDRERIRGLEAGADDFLQKPVNHAELLARVRSLLRVKNLFDQLAAREAELRELNAMLEQRVAEKAGEIGRLSRLKRFFAAPLAERIVSGDMDDPLASHRRDIAVVFVDLRGFTAFSDASAPEDVLRVLRDFHGILGRCIDESGGTIERFTGDGAMVFFNDPEPLANPCAAALQFALAVREGVSVLSRQWLREGFNLQVGVGVAYGYATLGAIGYAGRIDYGAVGTVTNMASRLCAEAGGGEVWAQQRVLALAGEDFAADVAIALRLRGFREEVLAARLR